jgi:hypothetical protein
LAAIETLHKWIESNAEPTITTKTTYAAAIPGRETSVNHTSLKQPEMSRIMTKKALPASTLSLRPT